MTNLILLCLFAGFLDSCGGAIKDTPSEGFKPFDFPRSIIISATVIPLTLWLTDTWYLVFIVNGYFTRCAVEVFKFVRHVIFERDFEKYFRHERMRRPQRFWKSKYNVEGNLRK